MHLFDTLNGSFFTTPSSFIGQRTAGSSAPVKGSFFKNFKGRRRLCPWEGRPTTNGSHTPLQNPWILGNSFPQVHIWARKTVKGRASQGKGQVEHSCSTPTIAGREEVQKEEQGRREAEGPVWSFPFVPCLDLPSQWIKVSTSPGPGPLTWQWQRLEPPLKPKDTEVDLQYILI